MRRISISPPVAALLLAIVLFLLSGFLPNSYSTLEVAIAQATNIVRLAVFLGVIAAGQTLVIISGSEGIDLSAGSVVTLTAILTYVYVSGENDRVLVALLISLGAGALIGLINGIGVTYLKISPFVMTLGMAGVVTGAIIVINHGNVSGRVAPIMTRMIARPISDAIPIPGAIVIWLIFGVRQPDHFQALRRPCFLDEPGNLLAGRRAGRVWRVPGGGEHRRSFHRIGTAVPVPVHCGGSCGRDPALGRERQLLGHDGWGNRPDAHYQPADYYADARVRQADGVRRNVIDLDFDLRPPALPAAINIMSLRGAFVAPKQSPLRRENLLKNCFPL